MSETWNAAIDGLAIVFSWPNILYPLFGTLLAMVVSILPGISGVALMAMVIPLTYFWDPLEITLLFGALVGGATFMGSVTAILLNIPGRNSNAATAIDGYPLSQRGLAKTAIASSATASALGSTFGVIILILSIPVLIPLSQAFGPLDMLMAIVWGITMIAYVVGDSWLKGLVIAGLGLTLSLIGSDPQTAEYRLTFGSDYLRDGLNPALVFLGIFAVSEMMDLSLKGSRSISGADHVRQLTGSVKDGIYSVFKNTGLFLRCSAIGTVIGMMPGVGSVVASLVAYAHASQSTKDNSQFGKGDIRGVIAPEAANDAKDGGALIPVLAIGLPGGLGTAMLLAAFSVHGITPGPGLLANNLTLVFVLIWSLFLSNWLTSLLGLGSVSLFARITTIPGFYLVPGILSVIILSAYTFRGESLDVLLAFVAGLLGFFMKKYGWPRIPFVIAFVLGPYFENYFHVTRQLAQLERIEWTNAPIATVLTVLILAGIASRIFKSKKIERPDATESDSPVFTFMLGLIILSLGVQLFSMSTYSMLVPGCVLSLCLVFIIFAYLNTRKQIKIGGNRKIGILMNKYHKIYYLVLPGLATVLVGPLIAITALFSTYLALSSPSRLSKTCVIAFFAGVFAFAYINWVLQRPFDGGLIFNQFF